MPRETDPRVLEILRRAFADRASNVVEFKKAAITGGSRRDEGLDALLAHVGERAERIRLLKQSIACWVDAGGVPNRNEKPGDAGLRIDAVVVYECRLEVEGVKLLVQVELLSDDPDDPAAKVHSVKRAY